MMEQHARHLSSPSPTSSFLFHHSERPFKNSSSSSPTCSASTSLTPLLSSAADDITNPDDCFSSTPSSAPTRLSLNHQGNHRHPHDDLLNHDIHGDVNPFGSESDQEHSPSMGDCDDDVNAHRNNNNQLNHHDPTADINNNHLHHSKTLQALPPACVAIHTHDSLTGAVDDDNGMHNMLSGSSTSSNSTMPLLTHDNDDVDNQHHSFGRISLEEYSPMSLVGGDVDCDADSLPISPISLACGSSSNFKSSLSNALKLENLLDVVGHSQNLHHHLNHHTNLNDDIHDARSLSPTLLSTSTGNLNNLWSSNSSTAITQNTSLFNGGPCSFLLSHHQQQLSSLMQQLEPQSLDEPPPLLNLCGPTSLDVSNQSSASSTHRPSSEPPPGAELVKIIDPKSGQHVSKGLKSSQSITHLKTNNNNNSNNCTNNINKQAASNSAASSPTQSPNRVARKSRNRSRTAKSLSSSSTTIGDSRKKLSNSSDNNLNTNNKSTSNNLNKGLTVETSNQNRPSPVHDTKLHLQLNHQAKLQELQLRLFGPNPTETGCGSSAAVAKAQQTLTRLSAEQEDKSRKIDAVILEIMKEEPDSSAESLKDGSNSVKSSSSSNDQSSSSTKCKSPPTTRHRNRRKTSEPDTPYSSSSRQQQQKATSLSKLTISTTPTEKAEPDTTTKTGPDSIKLADLLVGTGEAGSQQANNDLTNTGEIQDRKVQQIHLLSNPTLTLMTSGGLVQPIAIQQQQQPQQIHGTTATLNPNSLIGTSYANQILCRPQNIITTANGQLKGILSTNSNNNEISNSLGTLIKTGDTWSVQSIEGINNNNHNNILNNGQQLSSANLGNSQTSTSTATLGTHQIAIQVICQDGTSLVLPVSSATGLNGTVSLTPQLNLQPLLATTQQNNINHHQQQQRNANQLITLSNFIQQHQHSSNVVAISVGNEGSPYLANQQNLSSSSSASLASLSSSSTSTSAASTPTTNKLSGASSTGSFQTSALAASSPTLAALLDAGTGSSNRQQHSISNEQNFASTNILRKLVSGDFVKKPGSIEQQPKQQQTDLTLSSESTINLANCCPLFAVRATQPQSQQTQKQQQQDQQQQTEVTTIVNRQNKCEKLVSTCSSSLSSTSSTTSSESNGYSIDEPPSKKIKSESTTSKDDASLSSPGKSTSTKIVRKRVKKKKNSSSNKSKESKTNQPDLVTYLNTDSSGSPKYITHIMFKDSDQGKRELGDSMKTGTSDDIVKSKSIITIQSVDRSNRYNQSKLSSSSSSSSSCTTTTATSSATTTSDAARPHAAKIGSSTGNRQVDPNQPFRCEHCSSTFTRLGNFTRHKKIHSVPSKDGQRFKCDVCSKSFLQRCDLARHLHIHRGTEPHRCDICGKGYIRHSDLVTHQRFHNKEKPFGCPSCSKGFCQKGDLNRHLRSIHLQMKPVVCPCCTRKFAKQETLVRHMNSNHRSKIPEVIEHLNDAAKLASHPPLRIDPSGILVICDPPKDDHTYESAVAVSKIVASQIAAATSSYSGLNAISQTTKVSPRSQDDKSSSADDDSSASDTKANKTPIPDANTSTSSRSSSSSTPSASTQLKQQSQSPAQKGVKATSSQSSCGSASDKDKTKGENGSGKIKTNELAGQEDQDKTTSGLLVSANLQEITC